MQDGWTALHSACHNGHPEVVKMLLEAKAVVNMQNKASRVILICVCTCAACCDLVCAYIQFGGTPLTLSSFKGHQKCVQLLLKAGANVDILNGVSVNLYTSLSNLLQLFRAST